MRRLPTLLFLLLLSTAVSARNNTAAIRKVLSDQAAAWNRGDVTGYMAAGYWKNDSLVFIGKSGPTYGYDSTLARYKRGYPDKATMGTLSFDIKQIRKLSGRAAFVIGKWHLDRSSNPVGGTFTLLFQKKDGRWVITADHTS
jgi:ketosteroid isomerase-like protein